MSRALLFAAVIAVLPPACAKLLDKQPPPDEPLIPPPPSVPITSATTPPVWRPPDTRDAATPSSSVPTPPTTNPDLPKARAAADAKDWKKVKQLLDRRVKSGKASAEEVTLESEACTATKDKACLADIKAKYPAGGDAP